MEQWTEVVSTVANQSIDEILAIIDDALSHGFEFKVENGKLHTRQL